LLIYIIIGIIATAAIVWLIIAIRRTTPAEEPKPVDIPADCCGAHAVCERDSLLTKTTQIVYFDDEELDALQHKPLEQFSAQDLQMISDVFYTLREQDVAGWLRSLQLRDIALPDELRDEALLIVSERRMKKIEK
jgi:hypothetical protein